MIDRGDEPPSIASWNDVVDEFKIQSILDRSPRFPFFSFLICPIRDSGVRSTYTL